jgi:hypothetical protein
VLQPSHTLALLSCIVFLRLWSWDVKPCSFINKYYWFGGVLVSVNWTIWHYILEDFNLNTQPHEDRKCSCLQRGKRCKGIMIWRHSLHQNALNQLNLFVKNDFTVFQNVEGTYKHIWHKNGTTLIIQWLKPHCRNSMISPCVHIVAFRPVAR